MLGPLNGEVDDESLEGLAIQPDGKILTTGTEYPQTGSSAAIVSRYIADFEAGAPQKINPRPTRSRTRT